jgi:hypothetical protein
MSAMIFHQCKTLVEPWPGVPAIALGDAGIDSYLLVEQDGVPQRCFELRGCRDLYETWCTVEAICWKDQIVIGFAERVYLARAPWCDVRCIKLSKYFSDLHPGEDWLLVALGNQIIRLDDGGNIVWKSD